MSDPKSDLHRDLAALLEKHGAGKAAELVEVKQPARAIPGGAAASYIKEIITGDQAFDERTLSNVLNTLNRGLANK